MGAFESINLGAAPNDGTGDNLRAAMAKLNANFDEIEAREVHVANHGAVGDGATDDTAAFVAAFAAAAASGARIVLSAGKTYLLNTWTAHTNTVPIRISGRGATVKGPSVTVKFLSPAANFFIEDVSFDRWSSAVQRSRAQTGSYSEFRLLYNEFKNIDGLAIDVERPIDLYHIVGNKFHDNTGGYQIKVGENTYANQDDYLRGFILRNRFKTISASGSTSCAALLVYGREVEIASNIVDGISAANGEGWGIYTKTRFGRVHGNFIRNVKSTSSADVVGINVKGAPRALTTSPQGYNVVCHDNLVFDVGVSGTKGYGIRIQTDDVNCHDNLCEDTGIAGIALDDSNGSQDLFAHHNRVRFAVATGTTGIKVECNGNRISVGDNILDNVAIGINVNPSGGVLADLSLKDNKIFPSAAGSGIQITPTNNINDCACIDNEIGASTNGVVFNAGAGSINNLRMEGNDLRRATTKINGAVPSGTRLRGNKGYVTENGGVTAGITTGATVNHGLAVTPGSVVITPGGGTPAAVTVTALGATTFTINWTGGGTIAWYWEAKAPQYFN